MATLYIVGTPIGNMEDISLRALRILSEVDFILCEDTRVSGKLLGHYKIKTPTISFHQHSGEEKIKRVLTLLKQGRDLAYISDAGMPGISDPGGKLVRTVTEELGEDVEIESVPGPSAVTAALSISGLRADKFIFLGFLPHKKGRQKFLQKVMAAEYPVVVYESKYRIIKLLEELERMSKRESVESRNAKKQKEITNNQETIIKQIQITNNQNSKSKNRVKKLESIVVCRELSKMHETVYRGDIKKIIEQIKDNKNEQKGEFVVIIGK